LDNKKARAKSPRPPVASAPSRTEPPPSAWKLRAQALGRSPLGFALASLLLLIPCFWQSRIQAGDLSSHIYNAWLAQAIEAGKTTGLVVARQTTNVLFDLMLSALLRTFGASAAQRIAVAISVLVFAWGSFAFVSTVAGRRAWNLLPAIAILAYGWTFHIGFFNFYLSLGLCFFALALAWNWTPQRIAAAAVLLALAYVAHGLAVAWAVALLVYRWVALRLDERTRPRLLAGAFAAILLLAFVLGQKAQTRRSPQQLIAITAGDQAWIYDGKYLAVLLGLLLVWTVLFVRLLRQTGARRLFAEVPFHFCVLTAAGIFLLPTGIAIPGYKHVLTFIAERMSLALGICYCALLGGVRPPAFLRYVLPACMLLFFAFVYRDDRLLNRLEDRMQAAVAPLKDQRVASGIDDPYLRINAVTHMIDRACVGVCYSYANYEPSTGQFRVRAESPNPFVAYTYADSWQLQTGAYLVKPQDVPLFQVMFDDTGAMVVRSLPAGFQNGMTNWDVLAAN
jgi:hypothetical protein